jgi:hypothetical protein
MRAGLYGEVQPQPMTQLPLDPAVYAIRRRWMSMCRWFSPCRRGRAFDVYVVASRISAIGKNQNQN